MNWNKLKEKFPKSYNDIREFYINQNNKDDRTVLNKFLISKGYEAGLTFINNLKHYEQSRNN